MKLQFKPKIVKIGLDVREKMLKLLILSGALILTCIKKIQKTTYLEQFPVRYEPVVVHIVNSEGKSQLGEFVSFDAELRYALDEF